jgi:hypothetical protein
MYYFAKYLVHPVATTSQPVFPIDVKDPVDAKIRSDHLIINSAKRKKRAFRQPSLGSMGTHS